MGIMEPWVRVLEDEAAEAWIELTILVTMGGMSGTKSSSLQPNGIHWPHGYTDQEEVDDSAPTYVCYIQSNTFENLTLGVLTNVLTNVHTIG